MNFDRFKYILYGFLAIWVPMLQMDRSEYGFLVLSTPVRCVGIPAGAFFSGKMTSLEISDMYFVKFVVFCKYLVIFSQYLVKNH